MEKVSFQALPKQSQFIFDNHKFACFAGGFGCGKTLAGCVKSLVLSQLMPNNFGLIGRLTYPELRDTTRRAFFEFCPPDWYSQANGGFFKEGENHLKLYNGSEVIFRHLDTISRKELLSLNLGWFFIDQAEEISEEIFLILQSRLRLNNVSRRYGFLACNMEGHNWIWRRFLDPKHKQPDTFLIESSTYDNPHNPPDYARTLEQNYPEDWVRRYVIGSWEAFEGQVFTEFNPQDHVVDPFLIPNEWERIIAIDHGLINPTACLWGAVDFDGNLFIYDEYYVANEPVSVHAKAILEKTGSQPIEMWLIDPSTRVKNREKNGMPWSILEEYQDWGIYAVPANSEVLAGINRIKEYLKINPERLHHRTHLRGSPKLFITRNCVNLLEELPKYHWKKVRVVTESNLPEKPAKTEDHAVDALRYMIMSRYERTEKEDPKYAFVRRDERRRTNDITREETQEEIWKSYNME